MANAGLTFDQASKIRSLSLDKADLRTLLERLEERALAAGEKEAAAFNPSGRSPEEIRGLRAQIRDGHKLYVTIEGADGRKLNGGIREIFDSPNFPESGIRAVFFDSSTPLRVVHNYIVANKCVLYLSFARPAVLDFSLLPSLETPNESNVLVSGQDATWVNGVYHEVDGYVRARPSTFGWLHRHSVYDVLLWIFAFPLALWAAFRLSRRVELLPSSFLRAAIYVYIVYVGLIAFRVLFHYARWIWPRIEFRHEGDRATRQRVVWATLVLGILGSAAWDLAKRLFY